MFLGGGVRTGSCASEEAVLVKTHSSRGAKNYLCLRAFLTRCSLSTNHLFIECLQRASRKAGKLLMLSQYIGKAFVKMALYRILLTIFEF